MKNNSFTKPSIIGLACKLGSRVIPLEEIANQFGTIPENIKSKSGITKLYVCEQDENIVDITVETVRSVLQHTDIKIDQIDGIFGSSNPTSKTLIPSFTVQVATKVGLKNAIADHIGLGCCGGLQALRNAYNQLIVDSLNDHISYYLVVAADETSKILDPDNFSTSILFSEGCGVMVVTNDSERYDDRLTIEHINTKSLLTDQVSVESIKLSNRYFNAGESSFIQMDGKSIYRFGTTIMDDIMECAGISLMQFKQDEMYLVPHQPNLRILQSLMEKNKLTEGQMYINGIKTIGNTAGPATFFGLHDALQRDMFSTKRRVILGAFGAELQVGGALFTPQGDLKSILC